MLGFTFAAPLALAALIGLPALWILLRVTPPRPKRIDFPPLKLVADLIPQRQTPARTPPWLLILRMLIAAALILAVAGPVWSPGGIGAGGGKKALLVLIDNGFASAHDWRDRLRVATDTVEGAARDGRAVAVVGLAEPVAVVEAKPPAAALERLRAIAPRPYWAMRDAHLQGLGTFLDKNPGAGLVWIADGVAGLGDERFVKGLSDLAGGAGAALSVLKADRPPALALTVSENGGRLSAQILRAAPNGRDAGVVRALDQKGLPLAERDFAFTGDATRTEVAFDMPTELRNGISRIEVANERSAGAVSLVDERGKRRRVGLVFGGTLDQSQPLLAPLYYLSRALEPFADVQQARGAAGLSESVNQLLDNQVSVLVLADVGALDDKTAGRIDKFVEEGGLLLRFAGRASRRATTRWCRCACAGAVATSAAPSWDAPKTVAPFPPESPFAGLTPPADIGVRRQILAEPDGDLPGKTWASLQDGTPIVTAQTRGQGRIVLFHVTADTTWSNLPLSGLFIDMLRRVVALAGAGQANAQQGAGANQAKVAVLAPRVTLDGFGALGSPPAAATAVPADYADRASLEHPPGFYGPPDGGISVNALKPDDRLAPVDFAPLAGASLGSLAGAATVDLRPGLFTAALLFLVLDTLAGLWLGGFLSRLRALRARPAVLILAGVLAGAVPLHEARAAEAAANRPNGIESALITRLAYIVTGDAAVDEASRAGLAGLTQMLAARTALEPGEPAGLDPAKDELAFYPLIYWPIAPNRPQPSEAAIRKIDAFMRNGGTVLFDTRDALTSRPGSPPTPEAIYLRKMLGTLEVPELEPVPADHVLTKAFYLVDSFPGRYATARPGSRRFRPLPRGASAAPPARATG